jgi:hypothetical protein
VLSADYFSVPDEEIKTLESVLTIVGGKAVYAAHEFTNLAPPAPPVLPEWSPVATYGGYAKAAAVTASSHARSAFPHTHDHQCQNRDVDAGFGCLCWAF